MLARTELTPWPQRKKKKINTVIIYNKADARQIMKGIYTLLHPTTHCIIIEGQTTVYLEGK